ncbi:helix-hairpin-helix domain-containing protein [Sediminibacterium sp.]|uniref:helix-hairpin-helix domain-containing protein n=1 Tax=Sediminibacterium sp. TaxID=1917865 RepID=UPI0025D68484|nr:helix-hairpin-helix domain-containing protein [Sediminibacterium sp.]MBW0177596.1 helix-hairpin-helix domain-containing protein [Sediminibacterium sp.]
MKNSLRPYFSFTKKERTGIVVLVCISLVLFFLPHFFPAKELQVTDITLSTGLQTLAEQENNSITERTNTAGRVVELFPFNPNTIDAAVWMRLGLDEKLAQRIIHYRNKGGRFYRADDLKKIWGLQPEKAARLIPFAVLPEQEIKTLPAKKQVAVIDVNTADLKDWESLPGIGETLAGRIIKYRNQSAGFARLEELENVFGLSDSTLLLIRPYLQLNENSIQKLSLNRASAYQLIQKAALPAELAREIVKKRQEEGNYSNWSALEALSGMNKVLLEAIRKAFMLE